jgi:hypothetical protein
VTGVQTCALPISTIKGGDVDNHIDKFMDNFENTISEDERDEIIELYRQKHPEDQGWRLDSNALKDYVINHPEVLQKAMGITNQGSVMPCYLRMIKPCIIGFGRRDTWFNYDFDLNDEDEDNPEASGDAVTVLDVMSGYEQQEISDHSYADLYDHILDNQGIRSEELLNFVSRGWEYDEKQWYMVPFKEILQDLGYDGVILNAKRFFGVGKGTTGFANMKGVQQAIHYIVWEPNQIKSAIGNKGTFDINSNDIRESKNIPQYKDILNKKGRLTPEEEQVLKLIDTYKKTLQSQRNQGYGNSLKAQNALKKLKKLGYEGA